MSLIKEQQEEEFPLDRDEIVIHNERFARGKTKTFNLSLARLYDFTELSMPICVVRAKKPGPVIFVSGAVHGDEIIGPEIIKRLLVHKSLKLKRGTLITIPIVNVFGFNSCSRYLPDRRDLNRSFPGSAKGSLSARIAHIFLHEVIRKCSHGIDLHSGAVHRANLPQIRAMIDDQETRELAKAFGAPVILHSKIRDGSIRGEAEESRVKVLLYEAGEALRHDEQAIRVGIKGVLSVLAHIGMLDFNPGPRREAFMAQSSYWVRAGQSGVCRFFCKLGDRVSVGSKLATVSDTFLRSSYVIEATTPGMIIGINNLPLVNKGDAIFHVATFGENEEEHSREEVTDLFDPVI